MGAQAGGGAPEVTERRADWATGVAGAGTPGSVRREGPRSFVDWPDIRGTGSQASMVEGILKGMEGAHAHA
jgi:hypothetical protein